MKKNIFDTEIEMIDLDTIGNLEVSYDELAEPNQQLGNDLEMVMRETQVFSSEEVSAAMDRSGYENFDDTKVIETNIDELSSVSEGETFEQYAGNSDSELSDGAYGEYYADNGETGTETYDSYVAADDSYEFEAEEPPKPKKESVRRENFERRESVSRRESAAKREGAQGREKAERRTSSNHKNGSAHRNAAAHTGANVHRNSASHADKSYRHNASGAKNGSGHRQNDRQRENANHRIPASRRDEAPVFELGLVEYLGIGVGAILVLLLVILGAKLIGNNINKKNMNQFASLGALYSDIDGIGDKGINAIGAKIFEKSLSSVEEVPEVDEEEDEKEEIKDADAISVNFSSIEKDLKIKFTSKKTGKLVTGIRFEVTAKGPKGENFSWGDTDMDGVIYLDNLKPGNYEVKISDVGDYDFPDTATVVKVQDTIVYQVINVIDEAVDMSKVDLAKEDLQGKEVDEGPALTDTVAYVESSSKKTYVSVKKENITDPKNLASAFKFGGFRSVSGDVSLTVGGEQQVNVVINVPDGQELESVEWVSDDTAVATVSAPAGDSKSSTATIKGVTAGNTTVKAKITINKNTQDAEGNPEKETTEETFNVNVTESSTPVAVTGVEITGGNSVVKGQTLQLTATVAPTEATNKTVTWSSDKQEVATVDSNGLVTGVSAGDANITAESADGPKKTIVVTVTENATIVLTVKGPNGADIPATLNMLKDETYQLTSTVSGATDTGVTYSTSDNNSVTVSDAGLITAKTEGSADITVTTKAKGSDGKAVTKTFKVTVKADRTKDTTTPLKYTKEGKEYQVYIKKNDKFVEAKWADYYTNTEFFIEGETTYTGWQSLGNNEYYFTADGKKVTGDQVIKGMMYHFASDGALIKGSGVNGIDVSAYQGNINWTSVKNSGISFVIIRCAFRGYTQGGLILDSKYKEYIKGASDAGLKVGIYIFSQAVNDKEAVEEASLCVNLAQGYRISYPIFIDSEYSNRNHNGRADGLSKAQRTSVCKAFCETIKSAGYTPGVYASKSWFKDKLDANQLNGYRIWLAHYCGKTDYTGKYDLWQHSSTGSVNGISGNVDLDISYLGY